MPRLLPARLSAGRPRRGFSLLELALVLAILVAVAALVIPTFARTLDQQRLTSAADLIRAEWTRARVVAMKTGRIQVFRYELAGRKFALEPWQADDAAMETNQPAAPTGFGVAPTPVAKGGGEPDESLTRELPEGITFYSGEAETTARSVEIEQSFVATAATGAIWSQPVLFYADGSTSNAHVLLVNERQWQQRVDLRGLTGLATLGERGRMESPLASGEPQP